MTSTAPVPARTTTVAARRAGFLIAAVINAALLYAVNVWPGWQAVPFLTDETRQVLGLVNLSLVAGLFANVAYAVYRARWLRPLGDLVTTGIGLASTIRVLQVFPFAFPDAGFDWSTVARVLLIVAVVGAAIGVVVQVVTLVRVLVNDGTRAA